MVDADAVKGTDLESVIERFFAEPNVHICTCTTPNAGVMRRESIALNSQKSRYGCDVADRYLNGAGAGGDHCCRRSAADDLSRNVVAARGEPAMTRYMHLRGKAFAFVRFGQTH